MPSGTCLCGAVSFSVSGELDPPDACHCTQCRKQSGHVWASTDVARKNLDIDGMEHITWFDSSPGIRRGFCSVCGSVLLWEKSGGDQVSMSMGAFDSPTGTHLGKHIFVADKGDYYDIADGLPQNEQ